MSDERLAEVAEIIAADSEGLWLLLGPENGGKPRRREALMSLLVAAYGKGYEAGLRKGGRLMADAVIARVSE